jgi:hypothetical protein
MNLNISHLIRWRQLKMAMEDLEEEMGVPTAAGDVPSADRYTDGGREYTTSADRYTTAAGGSDG